VWPTGIATTEEAGTPARLGLGAAIPGLLRSQDEHGPRPALLEEQHRVVEPPPEDGRGHAVVLRGAQHRDRVNVLDVARVVVVGGPPDDERRRR
jgi:hypothetical protein